MNVSLKSYIQQFDLKHGFEDAVRSVDGEQYLFADGARRSVSPNGSTEEPPTVDQYRHAYPCTEPERRAALELAKRMVEYHQTRTENIKDQFHALKYQMSWGDYQPDQLDELKRLKQAHATAQYQFDEATEELRRLNPQESIRQGKAKSDAERAKRAAAAKAISI